MPASPIVGATASLISPGVESSSVRTCGSYVYEAMARPVLIEVLTTESDTDSPVWWEAWSVLPGARRTLVSTSSATLLCAVPEYQAD